MKTIVHFLFIVVILTFAVNSAYPNGTIDFISPTNNATIQNNNSESLIYVGIIINASNVISVNTKIILYTNNNTITSAYTGTLGFHELLSPGTYTYKAELLEMINSNLWTLTDTKSVTFNVKHTLYAANNFGSGSINLESTTQTSGSSVGKFIGAALSVGAIDQNDGAGYNRTWNTSGTNNSNWQRKSMTATSATNIAGATTRNYSYAVVSNDNCATIYAVLKKICNITFQNNYIGIGNAGTVNVNGTVYNSPSSNHLVVESNQIIAQPNSYSYNGIDYKFKNWTDNNGNVVSTNDYSAFYPSAHTTYTANNTGVPSLSAINMGFERVVGNPIKMSWTDNPNTNVTQYQIWRQVQGGTATLLATVGRGVRTYTDNSYTYTGSSSDKLLSYDVRQYYSTEATYSNPNFLTVYGKISVKTASENNNAKAVLNDEFIADYALEQNSPNPFNPSTIISYQVANDGFVSLKVYDILGREVKTLVNEVKTQGKYSVRFDASNLTSGIYIYQLKANGFSSIKKMILTK